MPFLQFDSFTELFPLQLHLDSMNVTALGMEIVTVLLLFLLRPSFAVEHCFFSLVTCRSYCCSRGGSPFLDFCCSDCSLSVNQATRDSFWCSGSLGRMGLLSTVTAALILLSIIIGLVVCLCCGCICSRVTGRQNPWRRRHTTAPSARSSTTVITSVDCITADVPPPYDSLAPNQACSPPAYDSIRQEGDTAAAATAAEPPPAYTEAQVAPQSPTSAPPAYSAEPPLSAEGLTAGAK